VLGFFRDVKNIGFGLSLGLDLGLMASGLELIEIGLVASNVYSVYQPRLLLSPLNQWRWSKIRGRPPMYVRGGIKAIFSDPLIIRDKSMGG